MIVSLNAVIRDSLDWVGYFLEIIVAEIGLVQVLGFYKALLIRSFQIHSKQKLLNFNKKLISEKLFGKFIFENHEWWSIGISPSFSSNIKTIFVCNEITKQNFHELNQTQKNRNLNLLN